MISTTAAQATSLFQYIDDQRSGAQFVQDMTALGNQPQRSQQDVAELDNGLVSIKSLESMVDKITNGETNVTPTKVKDMLNFYGSQVQKELQSLGKGYGLSEIRGLQVNDGQWQLPGQPEAPGNAQEQLLNYLNKDSRLSERMQKVMKLSELNEQLTAKSNAQTLQTKKVDDEQIESYLLNVSEDLRSRRHIGFNQGDLLLGTAGAAEKRYQTTFKPEEPNASS